MSTAEARPLVAITGATGFIGRRLIPILAAAGWRTRVLVRRDPADLAWGGLDIGLVPGSLFEPSSLKALVSGADAVIHLAGLIKAPRRGDYFVANRDGTEALGLALQQHAPAAHWLMVSSLAAREPGLSSYAASKQAAEAVALDLGGSRVSVLRPPAVYGPGDRETLTFFQMANWPRVPLIGTARARTAVIHVDDLCRAIVGLLQHGPTRAVHAVADAQPAGYSWQEIMQAAVQSQQIENARYFQLPTALLKLSALAGDVGALAGQANMLTSAKLRELLHPDWSVSPAEQLPISGWAPAYRLLDGFCDAVRAYRVAGWLGKPA